MKTFLVSISLIIAASSFAQKTKNTDFNLDKDYAIQSNGTLTLSVSDAKVYITGSSRTNAHVKIDREVQTRGIVFGEEEFAINIDDSDGNLSIKERSGSSTVGIVGYHYEKYTVNVDVPNGVSLRIKGDDGDYFVRNINGSMDIDLDDADIELTNCKGQDYSFRLDDGDVKMNGGAGKLDVDIDDGDIFIENAAFTGIQADIDDGDFNVQTTLADGGDYFIESQDGSITLVILGGGGKFDILHDDTRVQSDSAFNTVERSEDRTRLTLPKGNAKVDIRADDARVKLVSSN